MRTALVDGAVETLNRGSCPSCGERGFVLGPKFNALSLHIECANVACRERYTVAMLGGVIMSARTPSRAEGRLKWPSEPHWKGMRH